MHTIGIRPCPVTRISQVHTRQIPREGMSNPPTRSVPGSEAEEAQPTSKTAAPRGTSINSDAAEKTSTKSQSTSNTWVDASQQLTQSTSGGQSERDGTIPLHGNLLSVLNTGESESAAPQSMQEELHRLQVLKSYSIQDAEKVCEGLTKLAARLFKVDTALISLVDRAMSSRGVANANEPVTKFAFCLHTVVRNNGLIIFPDVSTESSFEDNPNVKVPPNVRFFAGAPMISPEGYRLGMFCIADTKLRADGLSKDDQTSLQDFADLAVKKLVKRRSDFNRNESPARLIAHTAHDLMTPLTGVQLSLSLLREDEDVKKRLSRYHRDVLSTASHCSALMIRIGQTMDALRQQSSTTPRSNSIVPETTPITKMTELVRSLILVMEPIPKKVPLVITLDRTVPSNIISDDLKLFRSILNLISNGLARTSEGVVHLRIRVKSNDSTKVFFECIDTGSAVPEDHYKYLFSGSRTEDTESRIGLSSLATLITSLNGEYGFESSDCDEPEHDEEGVMFWFSVPLFTRESFGLKTDDFLPLSVLRKIASSTSVTRDQLKEPIIRSGSKNSVTRTGSSEKQLDSRKSSRLSFLDTSNAKTSTPTPQSTKNALLNSLSSRTHLDFAQKKKSNLFSSIMGSPVDAKLPGIPTDLTIAKPAESTRQPTKTRTKRVLLIYDGPSIKKLVACDLKKMGIIATEAKGTEGFQKMKDALFDFVFCDLVFPLDHVQQYRQWEQQNRQDFTQYIVGVSPQNGVDNGLREKAIKAGMNRVLVDPVAESTVRAVQENPLVATNSKQLDEMEALGRSYDSTLSLADPMQRDNRDNGLAGKRPREPLSGQQNESFDVKPFGKRQRLEQAKGAKCLVAMENGSQVFQAACTKLESSGWTIFTTNSDKEVLHLMQRNEWGAILIDECVLQSQERTVLEDFRSWERKHRCNRQGKCFFVCSAQLPSVFDETSVILPPSGFDGVLKKPLVLNELVHVLQSEQG